MLKDKIRSLEKKLIDYTDGRGASRRGGDSPPRRSSRYVKSISKLSHLEFLLSNVILLTHFYLKLKTDDDIGQMEERMNQLKMEMHRVRVVQ